MTVFVLFSFTDLYLDYFTTPHFIFLRDSLSYLTLLGLNSYLCLTPPTIAFSRVEWVIFVFFVARILIEIDQFMGAKIAVKKAKKQRLLHGSAYVNLPSPLKKGENAKSSSSRLLKWFSKYFRYILFLAEDGGANRNQLWKSLSTATNDPVWDFLMKKKTGCSSTRLGM